jgi:hypothetical protein
MISKIWNWIKNFFVSEKQDPHLTLYEEVKNYKLDKINRKHKKIKHTHENGVTHSHENGDIPHEHKEGIN